jgi:hypothetical protein
VSRVSGACQSDLRIVFYDQGIGIPRSLPASGFYENILDLLSAVPMVDRKRDEVLLKAAIEYTRSSTNEEGRGKGLKDLLNYIEQLGDGYISILSRRGLFKFTKSGDLESTKSEHFETPIEGTLIIWKVCLNALSGREL